MASFTEVISQEVHCFLYLGCTFGTFTFVKRAISEIRTLVITIGVTQTLEQLTY
jgi:hypothetical protein